MSCSAADFRSRSSSLRWLDCLVLSAGRGIALFFGAFSLLNLGGDLIHPGFDASVWWVDVRGVPMVVTRSLILVFAFLMVEFARQPNAVRLISRLQKFAVAVAILVATRNAVTFHDLLSRGVITTSFPLPFSLFVATILLMVLAAMHIRVSEDQSSFRGRSVVAAAALLCTVTFPLLQIQCFGWTDYRRRADAAVVFGCKVYPGGELSAALADRVRSACDLYHQGYVGHLVVSGGPGQGDIHETDAMRDFAVTLGVPLDRILVDRSGLSTEQTVANTVPMFRKHGFGRVLAVSHFFHLPRIKLTYQRAGINVFTVPARQKSRLPNERFMLARETVALWAYYARPLTGL